MSRIQKTISKSLFCIVFLFCLIFFAALLTKVHGYGASAEEIRVVTFSDMGKAASGNVRYSQTHSGMYRAKRQNNVDIIAKTDYYRWDPVGCDYQNVTIKFSYRFTGENANFIVNFGGTDRNALDGYVFHIDAWESEHCIAFGRGVDGSTKLEQPYEAMEFKSDYTATDSLWAQNGLAPNDGNVYDVEVTFRQGIEIDGQTCGEVLNYKVSYGNLVLEDVRLCYEESRIKSKIFNLGVSGTDLEVYCGDKSYFEGELSVPESVIDISRIAEVGPDGVSSSVNVFSYPGQQKNQLVSFQFKSSDQSEIVLKKNNNINGNLTLDINCVRIGKNSISFGINIATVPVTFQGDSVTSWYKSGETYTVEYGVLEYEKDGVGTHNDIVCRIYDGNGMLVFDNRQIFGASLNKYYGFFINGTDGAFTVYPKNLYRKYHVFLHEADNSFTVLDINHGEEYTLPNGADLESVGTFESWYYMNEDEKIVVPTEGTWNYISNIKGTDENSEYYVFDLHADYRYEENTIEYVLTNGENHVDNPDTIRALQSVELKEPVCENGYAFYGWYDNDLYVGAPIKILSYDEDVTEIRLYAKILPSYTIIFEYPNNIMKLTVPANEAYSLSVEDIPGYTFVKWQLFHDGSYQDFSENTIYITNDIHLRAVYNIVNYTIQYRLNGGNNGDNPESYNIEDETIVLENPEKDDCFFVGWFCGEKRISSIPAGSYGNIALEAVFVKNNLPSTLEVFTGETFDIPFIIGLPEYAVYTVVIKDTVGNVVGKGPQAIIRQEGKYTIEYSIDTTAAAYTYIIEVNATEEVVDGCKIVGIKAGISDVISLYYRIQLADGYSDPYVIYSINNEEIIVRGYITQDNTYIFRFELPGIQFMTENIDAIVHAYGPDNADHKVCKVHSYTFSEYLYELLSSGAERLSLDNETYEKVQAAAVDLLNWGAEAQKLTETNTEMLANSELIAAWESKSTIFVIPEDKYAMSEETNKAIQFVDVSIDFDGKIGMAFTISLNPGMDHSGIRAIIDIAGDEYVIESTAFDTIINNELELLVIRFDTISALLYDEAFTVCIYDGTTAVSGRLTYSVNSFISDNYNDFYKAVYCCNQSLVALKEI